MKVDCVKSVIALCAGILLSACSTVIRTVDAGEAAVMTEERAALTDAARDLSWSPWPKPDGATFSARFSGGDAQGRVTRERAVETYLASLGGDDAVGRISADARRHLVAAAALTDAAERASASPSPRLSDVAVIEDAIADLRETRAVYIAALKKLDAKDDAIDEVRDPLDAAVRRLGRLADDLAESAMKKRSSNFAGPDTNASRSGAL